MNELSIIQWRLPAAFVFWRIGFGRLGLDREQPEQGIQDGLEPRREPAPFIIAAAVRLAGRPF
jgi:hypothetical protein